MKILCVVHDTFTNKVWDLVFKGYRTSRIADISQFIRQSIGQNCCLRYEGQLNPIEAIDTQIVSHCHLEESCRIEVTTLDSIPPVLCGVSQPGFVEDEKDLVYHLYERISLLTVDCLHQYSGDVSYQSVFRELYPIPLYVKIVDSLFQ